MTQRIDFTPDLQTRMRDGSLAPRTASAAEADVFDFGGVAQGIERVAFTRGMLVVDILALDGTTGDEVYDVVLQLSDNASGSDAGFDASDTVVDRAVVHTGTGLGIGSDDDYAIGQIRIGVDNEHLGTVYRFARLSTIVGGTSPSISYEAWLVPNN